MGKEQDLIQAIRNNDVSLVKKVLAKFKTKSKKTGKKNAVHIIDQDGFAPLHHAALNGNGEIVMALLEHVSDVNVKDKKGMTPLHLAAWAGKVEPALLLLDAGAETNLCSRSGATPLHLASEHGNYVVVERLVDHDCDPTIVNNEGETALDLACRFGHLEVVRILLSNGGGKCEKLLNPKEFQEKASPLHMAAKTGHFDVVKLLVENGADISQKGPFGTCLHEAALYGKTDVVKYLIEAGIDVNVKNREGQTALDMVTKFTKAGASSEIKHLLREASLEVVYAKAVKDYANISDHSFLTLRLGDIVLVLDRRKDGMWKGCIRDDQKERIGYFPSSAVKVLRSPSRNSVRSSTSSADGSKVSTMGAVSNAVEIVTVTPPTQPVAGKSRAPKMSSFRKKVPPKSVELNDQQRVNTNKNTAALETGARRRQTYGTTPRAQSVNELDERKKKLNYLDIVLVEKHNTSSQKDAPKSAPPTKTEYADVWLPKTNGADAVDGAVTAHAHETKDRLKNGHVFYRPEKRLRNGHEQLRQELEREQEERQRRMEQQKRLEQEVHRDANQGHDQQHATSQAGGSTEESCPALPLKARHYTVSSVISNSENLPPLPLKKRHSLSGRPSSRSPTESTPPPKFDKKIRSSLRSDRRGTSPPPPPPPPPVSSSPSPASEDTSPLATEVPTTETPLPPPMPKINRLNVESHSRSLLSPSPPPPPLPPTGEVGGVTSPSTSSLGDFPPPPPSLIAENQEADGSVTSPSVQLTVTNYASYTPRNNTCPLSTESSQDGVPEQASQIGEVREIKHPSGLQAPGHGRSRNGYEDMNRLKRSWTKTEVPSDKKGYVLVTPIRRATSPVNEPQPSPKAESSPSLLYENFTPLKTKLDDEHRSRSAPVVVPSPGQDTDGSSPQSPSSPSKPEKPCRHCYVNCEVVTEHGIKCDKSSVSSIQEVRSSSPDDSSIVSAAAESALPVEIPGTTKQSTVNVADLKMGEYDELYDWLAQSKLLTYIDNFAGAGFDLSAIAGLTVEDLSEIEITKTGHRKRLLSEAAKLPKPNLSYKNDVPSWLAHLGLSQYESNFMDGGFDDIEFLNDLALEDLRAIGVTKVGHQRKILMAAQRLEQREISNTSSEYKEVEHHSFEENTAKGGVGSIGGDLVGVKGLTAGQSVGEYAVPRVSHYNEIKPAKSISNTDSPDEFRLATETPSVEKEVVDSDSNRSEQVIEFSKETIIEIVETNTNIEFPVDKSTTMNGTLHDEHNVDGVKELAASFQHAIHEETKKAKAAPPPVKPKVFKKPPPAVAPKPKTNGYKVGKVVPNSEDINSTIDFTCVIKEAEALSESGSESPPSTLGRDHKSENRLSVEGSLRTNTSGSQGSLNSESEEFQREIIESLHQRKSSHTSVEDITKRLSQTLSVSHEDLLEQQKRDEELNKYYQEQNKTNALFTDIQGMLDNLSSELDDMFK